MLQCNEINSQNIKMEGIWHWKVFNYHNAGIIIFNNINGDVFKRRSHQFSEKVFYKRVFYGFYDGIIRGNKCFCLLPEMLRVKPSCCEWSCHIVSEAFMLGVKSSCCWLNLHVASKAFMLRVKLSCCEWSLHVASEAFMLWVKPSCCE